MLTSADVKELAKAGRDLDNLAIGLPTIERETRAANPRAAKASLAVNTEAMVDALDAGIRKIGELAAKKDRLDEIRVVGSYGNAQIRLAAARLLADYQLKAAMDQESDVAQNISSAIAKFRKLNVLNTSAVDILAAAILLPDPEFTKACFSVNHAPGALAGMFDVPLGAVELRQRVLYGDDPSCRD